MLSRFRPGPEIRLSATGRLHEKTAPSRRSFFARGAVALAGALALSGCASQPPASYDLAPAAASTLRAGAIRGALAVAEPHADAALDSDRIVIRTAPEQLAYLGKAQWADRLPALVQSRLIQSFENARMLRSVGRPGMMSDHSLATDIRRFEIDVTTGEARIDIVARILADRSGRVVAAQAFSASMPSPTTADGAAAAALDQALSDVLRRIVAWTASKI